MHPDEPIAIVGIGGLFPGAQTLDQFWANVRDGVDSTSDVPPGRWLIDPDRAYDPRIALEDHVYSTRGGYLDLPPLEPKGLDFDRSLLERLDPVFRLALLVAQQAWNDARTDRVDRDRVGVVFGNIVLPTETASAITREVIGRAFVEQLGVPAEPAGKTEPMNAFPAGLPAAVVARRWALRGPAYTIDAACGSSLYSLKLAIDELRAGRADAMLCGGVSRPDPLYTQMGFSQLRAPVGAGQARPLDQRCRRTCGRLKGRGCSCSSGSTTLRLMAIRFTASWLASAFPTTSMAISWPPAPRDSYEPCGWPTTRPAGARTMSI